MKHLTTRSVDYFESWFLERGITDEFFKYIFGTVSTTFRAPFSPIIFKRRQKSLQHISRTWQLTPKLSSLLNSSTGKRKNMFFLFLMVDLLAKINPTCMYSAITGGQYLKGWFTSKSEMDIFPLAWCVGDPPRPPSSSAANTLLRWKTPLLRGVSLLSGVHHAILYGVHNGIGKWQVCSSNGEGAEL